MARSKKPAKEPDAEVFDPTAKIDLSAGFDPTADVDPTGGLEPAEGTIEELEAAGRPKKGAATSGSVPVSLPEQKAQTRETAAAQSEADAAISARLTAKALEIAGAAERILHRLAESPLYRPHADESFPTPTPADAHVLKSAGFKVEGEYPVRYPLARDLHRVTCEKRQRAAKGSPAELEALELAAKQERRSAELRSMEIEEQIRLLQLEQRKVEDAAEAAEGARDTMATARRDLSNNLPPVLAASISAFLEANRNPIRSESAQARTRLEEIEEVLLYDAGDVPVSMASRLRPSLIDRREWDMYFAETVNRGRWEAYQRECEREAVQLRRVNEEAMRKENAVLLTERRAKELWVDEGLAAALAVLHE